MKVKTAKHFYRMLRQQKVEICMLITLLDVLQHTSTLSFSLQRSSLALAQVHRYLEATKAGLTKYKSKPGPMLKQTDGKATYEGTDLTGSDTSYIVSRSYESSY